MCLFARSSSSLNRYIFTLALRRECRRVSLRTYVGSIWAK